MIFRFLADIVVLLHLAFILFVVLGGVLAIRWPKIIPAHVPLVLWTVLLECRGWICPLTPLEDWLRRAGSQTGYTESFVEHYLMPIVYPAALTPKIQAGMAVTVIAFNALIYGCVCLPAVLRRFRRDCAG